MKKLNCVLVMKSISIIVAIPCFIVIQGCGKKSEENVSDKKIQEPLAVEKSVDHSNDTTRTKSITESVKTEETDAVENIYKEAEPTTKEMESAKPIIVNDHNFANVVLQSDIPVLVDFWASWCRPCLMAAPVLEKMSRQYHGQLKVCKLNVDEARQTSMKYGIRSIPTLYFFKDGNVVDQMIGVSPNYESDLREKIESNL